MEISANQVIKPVILKTITGYEFLNYDEIIRVEANRKVTLVYIVNRDKPLIVFCNLLTIESLLSIPAFYRCHRSHIVNIRHIKGFLVKSRQLVMINGNEIPISEERIREFKEKFIPGNQCSQKAIA